jgi:hypothetical protein
MLISVWFSSFLNLTSEHEWSFACILSSLIDSHSELSSNTNVPAVDSFTRAKINATKYLSNAENSIIRGLPEHVVATYEKYH